MEIAHWSERRVRDELVQRADRHVLRIARDMEDLSGRTLDHVDQPNERDISATPLPGFVDRLHDTKIADGSMHLDHLSPATHGLLQRLDDLVDAERGVDRPTDLEPGPWIAPMMPRQ